MFRLEKLLNTIFSNFENYNEVISHINFTLIYDAKGADLFMWKKNCPNYVDFPPRPLIELDLVMGGEDFYDTFRIFMVSLTFRGRNFGDFLPPPSWPLPPIYAPPPGCI